MWQLAAMDESRHLQIELLTPRRPSPNPSQLRNRSEVHPKTRSTAAMRKTVSAVDTMTMRSRRFQHCHCSPACSAAGSPALNKAYSQTSQDMPGYVAPAAALGHSNKLGHSTSTVPR